MQKKDYPKKFNKEELKNKLSQLQYHVTQEKGTERPFSGEYEHMYEKDPGIFNCVVCDQKIFETKAKFESGSGWPSFYDVINQDRVKLIEDVSYGILLSLQKKIIILNLNLFKRSILKV